MRRLAGFLLGGLAGTVCGTVAGFVCGAAFLAVAATVRSESFDGMGLFAFGTVGALPGALVGALVGVWVGLRLADKGRGGLRR